MADWSFVDIIITLDDGDVQRVTPRQSDIARVEVMMDGQPFSVKSLSYSFMFRLAYVTLLRLQKPAAASLDAFMDSVTISWE